MLTEVLKSIFTRDLKKLKTEIELYQNEERLWHIEKNIANSAGNLCLHLVGNLNTFIGRALGKTGYIRDREFEFAGKNVSRTELIQMIDETIAMVNLTLDKITDDVLYADYPLDVRSTKVTTEYWLIHLSSHLMYHLGQINYHRRLLDENIHK